MPKLASFIRNINFQEICMNYHNILPNHKNPKSEDFRKLFKKKTTKHTHTQSRNSSTVFHRI